MAILDQVREHVETGLSDEALLRLIDDAKTEVEARFGTDENVTQQVSPYQDGYDSVLILDRSATSIVSVSARRGDGTLDEVDDADYELRTPREVACLRGAWRGSFVVVYTPVAEVALRDRVVVDLVRLAVQYEGLGSQQVGDYGMSALDYHNERERLLAALSNRRGLRFA